MPTLYLLCGLPGSGKTTYARQLEERGAIRLGSDDWIVPLFVPLFGQYMPREVLDAGVSTVRRLQWDLTGKLLKAGVDVVLDDGFWTRAERQDYRARAAGLGIETRLVYFDVSVQELRRRLALRNQQLPPGTFEINDEALDLFVTKFEAPGPDEGAECPGEIPPMS